MTSRSHDLVMEFQTTFKRDIGDTQSPSITTGHETLRHKLIAEEIKETLDGIMFNDEVEIVDGCGDVEYVLQGAAITFGFELNPEEDLLNHLPGPINEPNVIGNLVMYTAALKSLEIHMDEYSINGFEFCLNMLLALIRKLAEFNDVPQDEAIEIIHQSNMSKLDAEGEPIINDWGKIMKGPNFWEPKEKIKELIKRGKVELPAA